MLSLERSNNDASKFKAVFLYIQFFVFVHSAAASASATVVAVATVLNISLGFSLTLIKNGKQRIDACFFRYCCSVTICIVVLT